MNDYTDHVFRKAEINGGFPRALQSRDDVWLLIVAKLWLLGAFVGMSLMVIAAELWWWDNAALPTPKLALLMFAGAVLVGLAWRVGSRLLVGVQRNLEEPVQGELPLRTGECVGEAKHARPRSPPEFAAVKRHARA